MGTFQRVAALSEVPPGTATSVEVDGRVLALFNVDGNITALDGECTHAGAPMCEAELDDGVLTCPWHAATYELESGKVLSRPATLDLERYPTRIDAGDIQVQLD